MTATCEFFDTTIQMFTRREAIFSTPRRGGASDDDQDGIQCGNAQVNQAFFDIVFDESERRVGRHLQGHKKFEVITADLNAGTSA